MAGPVVAYVVTGAAVVVRKDGRERYLYRGAKIPASAIDKSNAEHLVKLGLIEPAAAAKKPAAVAADE